MFYAWRIEDDSGIGPYWNGDTAGLAYGCRGSIFQPNPHAEGLRMTSFHFCGFRTLKQLKQWFNEYDREWLKKMGYKLVKYTARDRQCGKRQVIFKKGRKLEEREIPV